MTTFTGCATVCPTASHILLLIQGDLLILYVAQIPRVASLASVMNALALCFFESVSDEDLRFMITWYQWEEAVQKTNGKQSNSAGKMMEKICNERTLEE